MLTVLLIWWERNDLRAMHLDIVSIGIIILLKPVQTLVLGRWDVVDTPLAFPRPMAILLWAIAAALLLALWLDNYRPGRPESRTWVWLMWGLVAGIGFSALRNFDAFEMNTALNRRSAISLPSVARFTGLAFLYQIGFAAVSEEPLFRGFLWGYLRRLGWKEGWIWLFQAALFASAHVYFMQALAFDFWIVAPLAGLILGLCAWRTRSIAPGMRQHAAYNANAYLVLRRMFNAL